MADHDTPNIDKLDKLQHRLDADNPDSVDSPLNRFQHRLDADNPDSVNPLNAGGENLSLQEVQESLKGKVREPNASSKSELPLSRWIILYQASLSLFIQMIEQKVDQLPEPSEELQSEARKLRTDRRASASAVLNWLLYKLAVRNEKDKEIIQSELLHGLLMALGVRLDDKTIRSKEKARVDYNYVTILVASREVSPPSSPEGQQSQNSTSMSSSVLHEPIGLFVYLNPDSQSPTSTALQYICSETEPFVIPLCS